MFYLDIKRAHAGSLLAEAVYPWSKNIPLAQKLRPYLCCQGQRTPTGVCALAEEVSLFAALLGIIVQKILVAVTLAGLACSSVVLQLP